ncbi:TPA: DUF3278 domain-containing protein [Streptococcus agalactiae]
MNKENFTDRLIKRFYGISGPLDEYKRREADRMGNIALIFLVWFLMLGNVVALLLAEDFPQEVAMYYPMILELLVCILFGYLVYASNKTQLTKYDEDELSDKERKSIRHIGWKSGIYFGVFMYLTSYTWIDSPLSYFDYLLSGKALFTLVFTGSFFGISTAVVNYFNRRKGKEERE